MKGKDLIIVGAVAFVLWKLAQKRSQAVMQIGQTEYKTNMPVLDAPIDSAIDVFLPFKNFTGSENLIDAGVWYGTGQAFTQAGSGGSRYRQENPLPPSVIRVDELQ